VLDSNYNPHILYDLGFYKEIYWTLGLIEHLSNGGTGSRSRGTNMSFIHAFKSIAFTKARLDIGIKTFVSYKKDNGSPDVNEYMGTWALMIRLNNFLPLENYHAVEFRSNAGGKYGTKFSKGSNEISFYYQPTLDARFTIYSQVFSGRNEYLLDYKAYHRSARAGISLYL
jgi:outer membrane phospholipase A